MNSISCDVVVIGAGIIGISTAYYLTKLQPGLSVVLIDSDQPMALTSAQSGENYRNWWPHPVMTDFTDRSIDLMEEIEIESGNRINLSRRGYALATRTADIDNLLSELAAGYASAGNDAIRLHESNVSSSYSPAAHASWDSAPIGVDVIRNSTLIRETFPTYSEDIQSVIHIRRAGSLSGQQLGQYMLERYRSTGGIRVNGNVIALTQDDGFKISLEDNQGTITANQLVNAAGPYIGHIAELLDVDLPVTNILQQKIAFEDALSAIPRDMPFSIDLDAQKIDWTENERRVLQEDPSTRWLTEVLPGAIHCRPDGGDTGTWVKMGWAINAAEEVPQRQPELSDYFPEILLRAAARLNPSLKAYYGKLPRSLHHYGGYYTMTEENWPLVGEMNTQGAYVVGAMSGFGTMAACASGELCARWVTGMNKPDYALALSPQRYQNQSLMTEINALSSRGIL